MEKKTILVSGASFTYMDESKEMSYDNTGVIPEEYARNVLDLTQTLFSKARINVFLCFGTLLGAIREHGLIKWDSDVDVYAEDEEKLRKNLQFFSDKGLKLCRMIEHECYSFKMDTDSPSYIDVYIRRPCKRFSIWRFRNCMLSKSVTPKRFFANGYMEIDFLGLKCKCVKEPEKILEFWYGKKWRTPIKGHEGFLYEIPLARFVHKFPKKFFKFVIAYKYWKPMVKPDGKHWWFSKNAK